MIPVADLYGLGEIAGADQTKDVSVGKFNAPLGEAVVVQKLHLFDSSKGH